MPAFSLTPGTGGRAGLPSLMPVNMFYEASRTEPGGVILVGRPILRDFYAVAWDTGSPTLAVFQQDNVVGGAVVMLIGDFLCVATVNEGEVPDASNTAFALEVRIAGNSVGVVVTAGRDAFFWDGSDFRNVAFPDSADVRQVAEQGGRFIFLRRDSHKYYWTEPLANMLDGSGDIVIDSLDFASAESEPDDLLDIIVYRDHLVLAGRNTIEMHGVTGNDDAPWAPTLGSTVPLGIYSTGALTLFNNTFAWVDNRGVVRVYDGSGGARVSTVAIEREIQQKTAVGLDSFNFDGHELLRVKISGGESGTDYVYDAETQEWSEWTSGAEGWVAGPTLVLDGELMFGSREDGQLLRLSSTNGAGAAAEASITYSGYFGLPLDAGQVTMHSILFRGKTDVAATFEMRTSRDKGETFSVWRTKTTEDNKRKKIEFRSVGMFDQPGFLGQFRVADYSNLDPFYISGIYFNEFVEGRARG